MPKHFACNLGSINLSEFVDCEYSDNAHIDYELLKSAIKTSVKALDVVVDENANNHAIPEQKNNSINYRNIGLGIMGLSTAMFKLRIKYGSRESKDFVKELFNFVFRESVLASVELAKNYGTFTKYKECVFDSTIIKKHFSDEEITEMKKYGIRNCSILSIAPNGSIATMLGITGGVEPEFAIKYTRKTDNLKDSYDVYCTEAKYYMDKYNKSSLPDYFVCSADIKWKDRIDIQAIMQESIDTAISSTVNLPNETTIEEIEQLYLYAWEKGLKGITIFRDGCKRLGILTSDNKKEEVNTVTNMNGLSRGDIVQIDDNVIGRKRKLITGCGSLHCQEFFDPTTGMPLETYFSKGSQGGCSNFMVSLSRMISYALRIGGRIQDIKEQLDSCGVCPSYAVRSATKHDTSKGSCCPMAIGNALLSMYSEMQNEIGDDFGSDEVSKIEPSSKKENDNKVPLCPECGEKIYFEGGCNICKSCGWSKCG